MRRIRSAAGALALAALLLAGGTPAGALETDEFGMEPYPLFEHGEPRRSFAVSLSPGDSTSDEVRVWNASRRILVVRLYGADVRVVDGQYEIAAFEQRGEDAGGWVVPEVDEVRLRPGEDLVVPFTVRTPTVTSGDHTLALVAEADTGVSTGGVDVVARLALLIEVRGAGFTLAGLSWLIWLALALIVLGVLAALGLRRRARRGRPSPAPAPEPRVLAGAGRR